jgi:hypothetical protein
MITSMDQPVDTRQLSTKITLIISTTTTFITCMAIILTSMPYLKAVPIKQPVHLNINATDMTLDINMALTADTTLSPMAHIQTI